MGKRAHVLATRDVDGYALLWTLAPESIVSMLCEDKSEKKKKSTMAALETLQKENELVKQEKRQRARAGASRDCFKKRWGIATSEI